MNRKALVVEQDESLMRQICLALRELNLNPLGVPDLSQTLRSFYSFQPSIVLLDIDLPDCRGWDICSRIRELSCTPIFAISQHTDRDTLWKGYELGVDAFITKPFNSRELTSRVSAVLQRKSSNSLPDTPPPLDLQGLCIDWSQNEINVSGKKVSLTPTEFKLLKYLVENRGRVLTHEQILFKVWGPNYTGEKSFVKLYVRYLREKIESDPSKPRWIQTVRGFGYKFIA